jgi:hypothetical protein
MSEFFKTPMGRTFYESTVPRIAKALEEIPRIARALEGINENLKELVKILDEEYNGKRS